MSGPHTTLSRYLDARGTEVISVAWELQAPTDADRSYIGRITREWKTERPDLDPGNFLFQIYVMRLGPDGRAGLQPDVSYSLWGERK